MAKHQCLRLIENIRKNLIQNFESNRVWDDDEILYSSGSQSIYGNQYHLLFFSIDTASLIHDLLQYIHRENEESRVSNRLRVAPNRHVNHRDDSSMYLSGTGRSCPYQ